MTDFPEKVAFELVMPERLLVSESVDMVVVPGGEGDFGVLPGHTPMISTVRPGVVEMHDKAEKNERYFVSGGFAEVTNERCTVLAEEAISVSDIDRSAAEARVTKAQEDIMDAGDDTARATAEAELFVAEAMLSVASSTQGR